MRKELTTSILLRNYLRQINICCHSNLINICCQQTLLNSLGRSWMPKHFFWGLCPVSPALHPGFLDLWRSPPALSSIPTLGFFFECLGIQFFNSFTCELRDTMSRQRSLTLFTRMWLTGHHATPEVTHTLFPTQPFLPWVLRIWESVFYSQAFFTLHSLYLGKWRISLGVIGILSMYFRLHT